MATAFGLAICIRSVLLQCTSSPHSITGTATAVTTTVTGTLGHLTPLTTQSRMVSTDTELISWFSFDMVILNIDKMVVVLLAVYAKYHKFWCTLMMLAILLFAFSALELGLSINSWATTTYFLTKALSESWTDAFVDDPRTLAAIQDMFSCCGFYGWSDRTVLWVEGKAGFCGQVSHGIPAIMLPGCRSSLVQEYSPRQSVYDITVILLGFAQLVCISIVSTFTVWYSLRSGRVTLELSQQSFSTDHLYTQKVAVDSLRHVILSPACDEASMAVQITYPQNDANAT
ncbi:hypothetical protein BASA50_009724 [Batrachochytrium salamandrivorans]|uniref:Uncharacterized protein n=1 Tax=Batrachochytrium salamandrivorans TaxID=1357716 RepID=A0ABQ8F0P4_9FUNG|nr:hypothetical protein BASA62_004651 [Batrachochytrium salamandrivorans]KAH6590022.1 hypothetical protein BASA50_009724 [Batrachochytrium salamandrivorans]KAH6592302.1 hypothetical protein BASA61_004625 [Batrachochytrium salamandrivorans]KAH9270115.1 hypothetical protein BASA83_007790 [Batrachochytrium salamandrivorans]KAJ1336413.1 hypothetical protein BSLG_007197 [Batrachochytrium salamandrivorans]